MSTIPAAIDARLQLLGERRFEEAGVFRPHRDVAESVRVDGDGPYTATNVGDAAFDWSIPLGLESDHTVTVFDITAGNLHDAEQSHADRVAASLLAMLERYERRRPPDPVPKSKRVSEKRQLRQQSGQFGLLGKRIEHGPDFTLLVHGQLPPFTE